MRDPLDERFDPRRALVVVLLVLAALVVLGITKPNLLATIGVLLGIVLMIMVHEAGHYVTAKWSDMKVTEFFLGFGPRLWSVRRGETEYGVKALPLGGYVRIIGMNNLEEVDPQDEARTYRSKPYPNRLMVAVAGSTTHFLMAILLLIVIYAGLGTPQAKPVVEKVKSDSPAVDAGFRTGDRVVAVNGREIATWGEMLDAVQPHPGERLVVTVVRDGRRVDLPVVPQAEKVDGKTVGLIGLYPTVVEATRSLPRAAGGAVVDSGKIAGESLVALGRFFSPSHLSRYADSLTGNKQPADDTRFLSPVGAAKVASAAAKEGLRNVFYFLVLINVFVGVFNMIPLPPFDGGHVAIATYERIASAVTRRRVQVDMARILPVAATVVILLVFIGLSALWLDIVHPIRVQF